MENTLYKQASAILDQNKTNGSLDRKIKTHHQLVNLLSANIKSTDFSYTLSIFGLYVYNLLEEINSRSYWGKESKEFHFKEVEKGVDFIFQNTNKKTYFSQAPKFLTQLKVCLQEKKIKEIEEKYKINFNQTAIKELYLNQQYKNFSQKIPHTHNPQKLGNLIDEFTDFLNQHQIGVNIIEKFCENCNDLLILNIKHINGMTVNEKILKSTFENIWKYNTSLEVKKVLIENFIDIFKQTNVFMHTFAPMKKQSIALIKFFEIKSLPFIKNQEEMIELLTENKKLLTVNLEKRLENQEKLNNFNKINLNEKELMYLKEKKENKNNNARKKTKI